MTFEDWQAWLESQFVDDDEPSTGVSAPPAPEPISAKAPAILRLRDDLPPPPPGVTYATEPSPYVPETVAPRFIEPAPQPLAAYVPPVETPAPPPPPPADEADVPSIEQYLPFLRQPGIPTTDPVAPEPPPSNQMSPVVEAVVEQPVEPTPPLNVEAEEVIGTDETTEFEAVHEVDSTNRTVVETIIADIETIEVQYTVEPELVEEEPESASATATPAEAKTDAADMIAIAEETIRSEARDAERRTAAAQRHRSGPAIDVASPLSSDKLWGLAPRSNPIVIAHTEQVGPAGADFRRATESRLDLVSRLLDPNLPLSETARLLNVEPAEVQRKPSPTVLVNMRPAGENKRYKLSDVISFLEQQSRSMANDTQRAGVSP